jgi:ribose transport system permease protein
VSTAAGEVRRRRSPRLRVTPSLVLVVLIIVLVVIFGYYRPTIYSVDLVLFPMLRDLAIFAVVGLAQMCVLSIGHMNLAVGRMAAVGAMAAGAGYQYLHLTLASGLLLALIAGSLLGLLSGWLVARTGVHSFVVTLALDFALLGFVSLIYTTFTESAAFTSKPPGMNELRRASLADVCVARVCGSPAVPVLLLFALAAMLIIWLLYAHSRFGRELIAVGSSLRAAEMSGLPTGRRVILAHTLSGSLAALAGWLLAITTGSFKASIGAEFMLPSFLAPVLGGTLLAGGVISVVGTFLGAAFTQLIRRGLGLFEVGVEDLNIYIGVVLLLALSAERIRSLLGTRRRTTGTPAGPPGPTDAPTQTPEPAIAPHRADTSSSLGGGRRES